MPCFWLAYFDSYVFGFLIIFAEQMYSSNGDYSLWKREYSQRKQVDRPMNRLESKGKVSHLVQHQLYHRLRRLQNNNSGKVVEGSGTAISNYYNVDALVKLHLLTVIASISISTAYIYSPSFRMPINQHHFECRSYGRLRRRKLFRSLSINWDDYYGYVFIDKSLNTTKEVIKFMILQHQVRVLMLPVPETN